MIDFRQLFQLEKRDRFVFVAEAAARGCMATSHWTSDEGIVFKLVFAECNS